MQAKNDSRMSSEKPIKKCWNNQYAIEYNSRVNFSSIFKWPRRADVYFDRTKSTMQLPHIDNTQFTFHNELLYLTFFLKKRGVIFYNLYHL